MSELKMFYESELEPMHTSVFSSVTSSSSSTKFDRNKLAKDYKKMISGAVSEGYHRWWLSRFSIKRNGKIIIKSGMGKQKAYDLEKYKQMVFDKSLSKRFSDSYAKMRRSGGFK